MEIDTDKPTTPIDIVRERIKTACDKYNRDISDVTLIAVSKTRPASSIRELASHGQKVFAENYVQEGVGKVCELSDMQLNWHFIGHLQSNKSIEVDPKFTGAIGWKSSMLGHLDRMDEAKKILSDYLKLRPEIKNINDYEKVAPTVIKEILVEGLIKAGMPNE